MADETFIADGDSEATGEFWAEKKKIEREAR